MNYTLLGTTTRSIHMVRAQCKGQKSYSLFCLKMKMLCFTEWCGISSDVQYITNCRGAMDNKGAWSFGSRRGLLAYVYNGVSLTTE